MPDYDETITLIVNGNPTPVEVNSQAPLRTAVETALKKSSNTSRPVEDWELKDEQGNAFDLDRKIGDFGFTATLPLFLNVKAGTGG